MIYKAIWLALVGMVTVGAADKGAQITAYKKIADVPKECSLLGIIQSDDRSSQFVTMRLNTLAGKLQADALVFELKVTTSEPALSHGRDDGDPRWTSGKAYIYRCKGPWPGGSLPPSGVLFVTGSRSNIDEFLVIPKASGPTLGAPISGLGDLVLGATYSEVKALFNKAGLEIKVGPPIVDIKGGVPEGSAVIAGADDPKGRRWLYTRSWHLPAPFPAGTLLALSFDKDQRLLSIATLLFGSQHQITNTAKVLRETLDAKYIRHPSSRGPVYWLDRQAAGRAAALFVTRHPNQYLFLVYTQDGLEQVPQINGL